MVAAQGEGKGKGVLGEGQASKGTHTQAGKKAKAQEVMGATRGLQEGVQVEYGGGDWAGKGPSCGLARWWDGREPIELVKLGRN